MCFKTPENTGKHKICAFFFIKLLAHTNNYCTFTSSNSNNMNKNNISGSNYSILENGDVVNNNTGRILKPGISNGYYSVRIKINGQYKKLTIHRLLATAFIPNPENKPQVNHIDLDKKNNSLSNLEWCTGKENTVHYFTSTGQNAKNRPDKFREYRSDSKRIGVKRYKLQDSEALDIRERIKTISATSLANEFCVSKTTISRLVNRKTFKHI